MRYLNKVVFINSAHIPLAEVKVDGNVHFIGTQGVGKSTLLRAILFFYNADKQRLGIPKEKSSFDSYYFPYSNSYIVYEVMRENGAYCVVAAKSQGRVFFRFIDAPYNRDWFVDDTHTVYNDWSRIREQIGKQHFVSAQVTSYEMYRDIIFGNNRRQELVAYRKFAIVESAKYQNIPRTIQNVFLNTKLDADFIKDTIIRSMSDDEVAIDLDFYRNQIKTFEQEYQDVMLWFNKNAKGEIVIRKQADNVINAYRDLLYTQKQIEEGREELNYAGRMAEEERPLLQNEIDRKREEQASTTKKIEELTDKYKKDRDDLIERLGSLKTMLQTIRKKQQHYDSIRINEIITRVEKEDKLQTQKRQLEESRLGLMSAFNDIEQRYKTLIGNLENDCNAFGTECERLIVLKQQEVATRKEEIRAEQRKQEDDILQSYSDMLESMREKETQIRVAQEGERLKLVSLALEQPNKKKKEDCLKEQESLDRRAFELEIDIKNQKTGATHLRQEFEQKKKELDRETGEAVAVIKKEREALSEAQRRINNLIDSRKGSLCEWLDTHKPGWKDTIGKIAEEDTILYSRELNPVAVAASDSFFGVKLDLTNISRSIRTPDDLVLERDELQKQIDQLTKELHRLNTVSAEAVAELEKKYNSKIRIQNNELHQKEAELSQIPQKIKYQKLELAELENEEQVWQKAQREAIEHKQNELSHQLIQAEKEKSECLAEQERKLSTCRRKNNEVIRELGKGFDSFKAVQKEEIAQRNATVQSQINALLKAKQSELIGKGADVNVINQYDAEIVTTTTELDYIKSNRVHVIEYEKDKRELFDNEVSLREQEKRIKAKKENLEGDYENKKQLLDSKLSGLKESLSKLIKDLGDIDGGLKERNEFLGNESFCPLGSDVFRERITRKSCQSIVKELKDLFYSTTKKGDEFKRSVTLFKGNFSAKNTFHFKMELISETDYFDFASNLCEFVDHDKIAEYQKRISERYIDIIRRISKEVGDLTKHESEIFKTIKDINDDFNKRNFAGVIKEIALQPDQTNDKIVQLLLEVKRFNEENEYSMGEVDLFSQAQPAREEVNAKAISYLLAFMKHLLDDPGRRFVALSDTFQLKFRVKENDNDTGWIEKIANVGSEGTDILVKAMVNIMLINVFKEKASRKFGEFRIHCMMDEIGKLHPNNVKGILEFANSRNILLINSSPTTFNAADYRYTYLLSKDGHSNTQVVPLLTNTLR